MEQKVLNTNDKKGWLGMGKRIIVISGFSGVGKGTMVRHLLELNRSMPMRAKLWLSVSDTTRSPRKDGGDNYNFISSEEYNNRIASGYYLEHNKYGNHGYGTPVKPVLAALEHGNTVVLEIDYYGMVQVRDYFRDSDVSVTTIFICTEGNELFGRLHKRGDSPIEIKKRLSAACSEASHVDEFDCLIDNCVLEDAVNLLWLIATGKTDSKRNTFDSLRFIDQVQSILKVFDSVSSAEGA